MKVYYDRDAELELLKGKPGQDDLRQIIALASAWTANQSHPRHII